MLQAKLDAMRPTKYIFKHCYFPVFVILKPQCEINSWILQKYRSRISAE
jgi:hypothetical protein